MNKHHKNELATAKSMLTDAVFKCPAEKCASKLSFSEYLDGECCEGIKREKISVEYEKQRNVINEFDEALKNEENIEKELVETKIALEKIELKLKEAITKRKKIQEKMRIAAIKIAHGLRDPEKPEDNRHECKICLEEYNGDKRRESVLHCGHRSCFRCLTALPYKLCPICRKEFTAEQIIKIF